MRQMTKAICLPKEKKMSKISYKFRIELRKKENHAKNIVLTKQQNGMI